MKTSVLHHAAEKNGKARVPMDGSGVRLQFVLNRIMRKPLLLTVAFIGLVLFTLGCQVRSAELTAAGTERDTRAPENRVRPTENGQPLNLPLREPKIVVKKNQRQLLLFSGDKLVRTYRIGLGQIGRAHV